jgi:hypothetical protein
MSRPSLFRFATLLLGLSFVFVMPIAGTAGAAAGSRPAALPRLGNAHFHLLTKAQAAKLSRSVDDHVIVVLKNQFSNVKGRAHADILRRAAVISNAQRSIIDELHQVKARNVLGFRLINAVRATVSHLEAARLRSNPAVRAVVPDASLPIPKANTPFTKADVAAFKRAAARHSSYLPKCDFKGTTLLQPEALQLTHTAYANTTKDQAQNYATGAGVKVAILSGPLDPFNQDFIRPDGSTVITDYENFTPEPSSAIPGPSANIESYLDMSSVGSQGREVFNSNDWFDNALGTGQECRNFRILGMSPGASVMWLEVFNQTFTNSSIIQAIQYAAFNGASVMSESFGANPASDTSVDVVSMADQAAVGDGVTVVVSSGDAGPGGSIGSPATASGIISAGATTQEQFRQIIGQLPSSVKASNGQVLQYTKFQDNNIAAFSSSGVSQNGGHGVDVVAPGAFGFIDCDPNPIQDVACTNGLGLPSPFAIVGGTSESAPLTAGEAADVIEAYMNAHGGQHPTPATVEQIITSTATDLHDSSEEQGAGLIDTLRAVKAAMSWKAAKPVGHGLLTSPSTLAATGNADSSVSLPFTVSNAGASTETVRPSGRVLGATSVQDINVPVTSSDIYTFVPFTVPNRTRHLSVDESWDVVKQPYSFVLVTLIGPGGTYNDNTQNGQPGAPFTSSGFGHVEVSDPHSGAWTAVVHNEGGSLTGTVHLAISTSKPVTVGTVTPSTATIAPGATASFHLDTQFSAGGDTNYDVQIQRKVAGGWTSGAGTIPVYLRALVPISGGTGSFTGTIAGGNGRFGALYSTTYEFSVPTGLKDLDLSVALPDSNDNLEGVLVGPDGQTRDIQSTITGLDENPKDATFGLPNGYTNTMQFFWRNPDPGTWRFVLLINGNVSGDEVYQTFHGTITFNGASVSAPALPNSASTMLPASTPLAVPVTIKNTGNTTKSYYVDPRLSQNVLGAGSVSFPLTPGAGATFLEPSETSAFTFSAESLPTTTTPSQPISFDVGGNDGAPPFGFGTDPDVEATPGFNVATSDYTASLTEAAGELTSGVYLVGPQEIGPYPPTGAPLTGISVGDVFQTQGFNTDIAPSTGDLWEALLNVTTQPYAPLVLAPGQTGTITVTITPTAGSGTTVSGNLYVDTFAATTGFPAASPSSPITWSGDEVAALPYTYTVK